MSDGLYRNTKEPCPGSNCFWGLYCALLLWNMGLRSNDARGVDIPSVFSYDRKKDAPKRKGTRWKKITSKKLWKAGFILGAIYLFITYLPEIRRGCGHCDWRAFPLLTGCIMAYILNLLVKRLEKWYFPRSQSRLVQKTRRPVCILFLCSPGL